MPARMIRTNCKSVTGFLVPSDGTEPYYFESLLEGDLGTILCFLSPKLIVKFEAQPLTLRSSGSIDQSQRYTPDTRIVFRGGPFLRKCSTSRPWLVEVKYSDDLRKRWSEYRRRFRLATHYAMKSGCFFHILTERHIRTELLRTSRFLVPYRRIPARPEIVKKILDFVRLNRTATPTEILAAASLGPSDGLIELSQTWRLLAFGLLPFDLNLPLTPMTRLQLPAEAAHV